jgi:hypothetical protein
MVLFYLLVMLHQIWMEFATAKTNVVIPGLDLDELRQKYSGHALDRLR